MNEAEVSHIYPTSLELGKNHTIFISGNNFKIDDSYLCQFNNDILAIKAIQLALRINETHLMCN
jgi:hypothetical protein